MIDFPIWKKSLFESLLIVNLNLYKLWILIFTNCELESLTHANFPTFTFFLHLVKAVISMIAWYDWLSYLKEVFIWIFINCKFLTLSNFPTFTFVAFYIWWTKLYDKYVSSDLNLYKLEIWLFKFLHY